MRTLICFYIFFIPFCLFFLDVFGQCQNDQRSILIQLKDSLPFSSAISNKLATWNTNVTTDCCTWGGVTCSSSGQVSGLDLSNEAIRGGINDSSVLFNLKNLQSLNLAANNFNFTKIPTRFGSFASLLYLNLSNSMFSGQIPQELSQLTRLKVLDLTSQFTYTSNSFRSVSYTYPPLKLENPNLTMLVHNMTQLRGLYMDNSNMSSNNLDWCQGLSSSLPNLEVISLSNCQLLGPLDDSLEKLQSLSVINLAKNKLGSPVPNFFANFKNLTILNLKSCYLIGTFPKNVLQLQKLQSLDLSMNTNLIGSLPEFPMTRALQSLLISETKFYGEIPESIGNLKNLSKIDLYNSNFSGRIPKSMEKLTHLSYIDLSVNRLTGQIPSFQLCKSLQYIDLSSNSLSGMIPSPFFQDLQSLFSVDLSFNGFDGNIPSSLFSLPKLLKIDLSNNNFDGLLPEVSNSSIPSLGWLYLSSNKLEGEIPRSFFELGQLSALILSANNLSGVIKIDEFQGLSNLTDLDLSFNNLSILSSTNNSSLVSYLPNLIFFKMASCNLQEFPNLRNHSTLTRIDLSDNKIQGEIPNWFWEVGNGQLTQMNLSHNELTGLQEPYKFLYLDVLDLHSNHLSGPIPIPPKSAKYIDYSHNLFNSSLSESIGRNLSTSAYFFSVSNNLLTGTIPDTICNSTYLEVLDLSYNRLNGSIPQCLIELSGHIYVENVGYRLIEYGGNLGVLNLGNNHLSGQIEGIFSSGCRLNTLDLHGNSLVGEIPRSLVACTMLEVLNLGNNKINDTYPCFLGSNTNLRVLVLRSNMFHESVHCDQNQQNSTSKLQILDIAHNNFSGVVPPDFFRQCGAMMTNDYGDPSSKNHLSFTVYDNMELYYQDSVTVIVKGIELELVKILTIFTTIDISSNRFSGVIPETIGQLKSLHLLNASHNEFTGSIPPSIAHLSQLESLDMSSNKITGEIPSVLTTLSFLSALNLSYNQLEGKIPTGSQFQTFSDTSYLGNKRLCGFPLNRICTTSAVPVPSSSPKSDTSSDGDDWQDIFYGMGAGAGSVIIVAVLYTVYKANTSSSTRQTRPV